MLMDSDSKSPRKLPTNNLTTNMQVSIQKIPTGNTKYQNNIIASKLTNSTVIPSSESELEDILDKEFERMNISLSK